MQMVTEITPIPNTLPHPIRKKAETYQQQHVDEMTVTADEWYTLCLMN